MVKKNCRFTDGAAPSGEWKGDAYELMNNEALPDTITCALCERELPLERYSSSSKKRLLSAIRQNGMGALDNRQIVRCDGCSTQSRPEIHCMSCNQVRPINEFAHTQRQFAPFSQSTCLPCQDESQLDERDKTLGKQDEITEITEITQGLENLTPGQVADKEYESAPAVTETIGMAENKMRKESTPENDEDTFMPADRRFWNGAESWTGGASSASAIRTPAHGKDIGDFLFDDLFIDDDDDHTVYSSSSQW